MAEPRPTLPVATAAGTLAQTSLANALVYVRSKRLTGTFDLHAGDGRAVRMRLWRGLVVEILTTPPVARFADVAFELGYIGAEALARVTMQAELERRAPADLLLESGAITRAQRDEAWSQQARRRIHHAFGFPPGTTYTFAGTEATGAEPALSLDPLVPVWRALTAGPPPPTLDAIRARIEAGPIALADDARLDHADFPSDERAVLEALAAGPCTLAELHARSPLPAERVDLLVHLLMLARCVHTQRPSTVLETDERRTGTLPAPPPAPQAVADAPTRKVPKWRSFELSLTDIEERLAEHARVDPATPEQPKPKSPAELGAEGVRQRAARIAFETPHAALGLPEGASIEAARAAYVHASRAWHPHRLPAELEHVSAEAACVYMHMVEAYGSLSEQNLAGAADLGERPAHADGQSGS